MHASRTVWLTGLLLILPLLLAACVVQPVGAPQPKTLTADEMANLAVKSAESGLSVEQLVLLSDLKDRGPAPELTNEMWFNTESFGGGPLQLADLRGNVVIVEFWTYG